MALASSSYYYQPQPESEENLRLLRRLDEFYMEAPFFGSRRMAVATRQSQTMQRLMRIAGIEALYPKPRLSRSAPGHQIYPYLLRDVVSRRPDHVWSTDITYVPMRGGFLYLVAVMDWFSRYVLSWELSNTACDHLEPLHTPSVCSFQEMIKPLQKAKLSLPQGRQSGREQALLR